jgi:L-seryl-tRNA(Ser) seleniumtransferase
LRIDKIRLAAIEATLKLYRDPERLAVRVPTLRALARPCKDIEASARRLQPAVAAHLGRDYDVAVVACASQVGSGAVPVETLPSAALALRPVKSRGGRALRELAAALRRLPVPVLGRIANDTLLLDLRCLGSEQTFLDNIATLARRHESDSG